MRYAVGDTPALAVGCSMNTPRIDIPRIALAHLGHLALVALAAAGSAQAQTAPAPDFAAVSKVLEARCVVCHQGDAAPLGLRLDSHAALMKGSQRGPAVKPGDAAASELMRRIRGQSQPRMPLTGPPFLSDSETATIERWIADGARAPASAPAAAASAPARRATDPLTYNDVAPLLLGRCAKCHTDNGLMGPPPEGYRLNNFANSIDARDRARIVPGNPAASELLRRVRGASTPRMPFDGPPYLSDADIGLLERWVAQGARDAEGKPAPIPVGASVRLRGVLTAPNEVDGARFNMSGARAEGGLTVGDTVELRATIEADGGLRATRIRSR